MKINISRVVAVDVDRAWQLTSDFYHVHHIHPKIRDVTQLADQEGVGAVRQCNFYTGQKVQEEVIQYSDQKRSYTIELRPTDETPLKTALVTLSVVAMGPGRSEIRAEMDFEPKYGVPGKIMGQLLMKPQLGGILDSLLAGVQYYDRKGTDVPQDWKPPSPIVAA